MKFLKIVIAVLLSVVLLVLGYLYFGFKLYSPEDNKIVADENLSGYYSSTYDEARGRFREKVLSLSKKYSGVETNYFKVPSETDTALYVDICYVPAQRENAKLIIITSGIHGVEGFAGSAVQLMVSDMLIEDHSLDSTGVLFIHGLNPYGFKYCRKATENNVDLNRNCMVNPEHFNTENDGFKMLYDLLTPAGEVNVNSLKNQLFPAIAIKNIVKHGMPVLRQAALQGQYDFKEGIYYGGKKYEPQIDSLIPILANVINIYDKTLNIDLHTGYGEWGRMHLFVDPVDDTVVMNGLNTVFEGEEIDWGSGNDFYTINGPFVELVSAIVDSSLVLPMMFEFGTMNSSTTFGSLKSIHTMILENQGFNNGYKSEKNEVKAKADMTELYNPVSEAWKSETIRDAEAMFNKVFENFDY